MSRISSVLSTLSGSYSTSSPEAREKATSLGILALILALIFASGPLSALVINVFFSQAVYNAGDTVYTTINVTTQSNEVFLAPVYYSVMAFNGSYEFSNRQAQAVNCNSTTYGSYAYGYGYGYGYSSGTAPCSYAANFTLSDFQANGTYALLSNVSNVTNTTTFTVNQTLATGRAVNGSGTPITVNVSFMDSTNQSSRRDFADFLGNFSVNFNPNKYFKVQFTPVGVDLPVFTTSVRLTPYAFGDIRIEKQVDASQVVPAPGAPNITVNVSNASSLVFNTSNLTTTTATQNVITNPNATANATVIVPVKLMGSNITVNLTLTISNGTSRPVIQVPEQNLIVSPQNANLTDIKVNPASQELQVTMLGSGIQDVVIFTLQLPKQFRFSNGTAWISLSNGTAGLWNYSYSSVSGGYLINATVKYSSPGNISLTWRSLNGTAAAAGVSGTAVTVSGTVKDDLGASVSDATVTIYRDGSSTALTATSGGAYSYSFADSAVGAHTILVNASKDGYVSSEVSAAYAIASSGGGGSSSSSNVTNVTEEVKKYPPAPPAVVNKTVEAPPANKTVEAPKTVPQPPAEPVETTEQRAIRDIITQASYDLESLSGKLTANPDALALLNAARQKLAQADLMFSQGNYGQAKKLVAEARALIDQAESLSAAPEGKGFFKAFIVLVVLLAVIGAAAYYGYSKYGKKKAKPFTPQPPAHPLHEHAHHKHKKTHIALLAFAGIALTGAGLFLVLF